MTVKQLIRQLEDFNPDSEVRLAIQPSWPFEHSIGNVVSVGLTDEDADEDEEVPDYANTGEEIVYIGEGYQVGYLPGQASHELGWR
jgi:hypothetical protein